MSRIREGAQQAGRTGSGSNIRQVMVRAFFFGVGAFVGLWGMSLFAVDGVLLSVTPELLQGKLLKTVTTVCSDGRPMIDPPDWIGYTLVGMGGLTMLYSVALPRG
ncbi:MAG: hypothetical protein R3B90_03050 [Planctomycetaceae bacterium]